MFRHVYNNPYRTLLSTHVRHPYGLWYMATLSGVGLFDSHLDALIEECVVNQGCAVHE